MTLRTRLLIGIAVVAAALFGAVVYNTRATRRELIGQIDDRLTMLTESYQHRESDYPDDDEPASIERISDLYEGYLTDDGTLHTMFAPNTAGDEQAGVPDITAGDVPSSGTVLTTRDSTVGDGTYRALIQAVDSDGALAYVVAIPIDDVEATIDRLVLEQSAAALVALLALALVGWWVLRLGIRPMQQMTDVATRIADGELGVRVPEARSRTESGRLASALNRMLTQIQSALDDRSRSEQRLRQFVADASHELRTPVTTIRGYAELYRIGGLSDPEALSDAMQRTERQAARMSRLVADLLTLAEFDRQRPLELVPVDVVELARDAVAEGRVRSPDRTLDLVTSVPRADVTGDPDRLRQAIDNLIQNAVVHTESPIAVAVGVVGDDVVLDVIDHGDGMPPEVAARVTERFFRADASRTRATGGSGLGLSIVEAIVEAHHGSVRIDSTEGHGTTVRVTLPARAG